MCRLLTNVEAGLRGQGHGLGHVIEEQHHFRHVVEMALHCTGNTYPSFFQLAIGAEAPILSLLTQESRPFFESLFEAADAYGSEKEKAVLEGFWGHSIALGEGLSQSEAELHLTSSVSRLRQFSPSFHLAWSLMNLGILKSRQGKYDVAISLLKQALAVAKQSHPYSLGPDIPVTRTRIAEIILKIKVFLVSPLTAMDRIDEARRRLNSTLKEMNSPLFRRHPSLPILLNTKGIFEDRVEQDLPTAIIYYRNSIAERRHLESLKPNLLIIPLVNLATAILKLNDPTREQEALNYLEQALKLCVRTGWYKFQTAFCLTRMISVKIKHPDKLSEAFVNAVDADRVLARCAMDHEQRLLTNLYLGLIEPKMAEMAARQTAGTGTAPPQEYRIPAEYRRKSGLNFFQDVVNRMKAMTANLTGDGHYWVLAAYGHLIILTWNDPDVSFKYRKEFFEYFEACMCLPHGKDESRSLFLCMEPVYNVLRETSCSISDLSAFASVFCGVCKESRPGDDVFWCQLVENSNPPNQGN